MIDACKTYDVPTSNVNSACMYLLLRVVLSIAETDNEVADRLILNEIA